MFAGTSNSLDFLPLDRAGNRRFLPIMVDQGKATKHILEDETEARAYIDQMWAEAMVIYRSDDFRLALPGELEEEARSRQREFMPEDTIAGQIQSWLYCRRQSRHPAGNRRRFHYITHQGRFLREPA